MEPQPDKTDKQLQAFMLSNDPDVLYLWQAMKEPDWPQFKASMQHEIDEHQKNGHWEIVLSLIQSVLHGWYSRQLDFFMAYTQAPVERELYMEIPKGVTIVNEHDRSKYAICLIKNLYGQKQAGCVWYQYLAKNLSELGFTQSLVDQCVFYRGTCVLLVYVDDTIILGPVKADVDQAIALIKTKFQLGEEGDLCNYLGIKVTKLPDGTITLTQPHLIDAILTDLKIAM